MECFRDEVFARSVLALEHDGGGLARGDPPHEIQHITHGARFGHDFTFLGIRFFGDVGDGSDHALQLAILGVNLSGPHDRQAFPAGSGPQSQGATRGADRLIDSQQDAAIRFTDRTAENFLTGLADHFLGGHSEKLFR